MEFLFSNHKPTKTGHNSFYEQFYSLLSESTSLDIAVAYVTTDSLAELQRAVEMHELQGLRLIIGMHRFDGFSRTEYNTAMDLNEYLVNSGIGSVKLVNRFRFHGKLYVFENEGAPYAGIIGSDNLSSIVKSTNRIYEVSALLKNESDVATLKSFINRLDETVTERIDRCEITEFNENNLLLADHENIYPVSEVELIEIKNQRTGISFNIPLKATPKANLNCFFGKGREGKGGVDIPRHWYEVELNLPAELRKQPDYPQFDAESRIFDVITDDGWRFECRVGGQDNKNFRSSGDLTILGKWIKGRLEHAGALRVGDEVTEEVYKKYGRGHVTLYKTCQNGVWFLDFGVPR